MGSDGLDISATRPISSVPTWAVATVSATTGDIPPETLEKLGSGNSFVLMRLVAEGGAGEVWQALQTSLDRVVAVKRIQEKHYERLRRDGHSSNFLDHQFQQEAVVTAHLEHPNIVPVYDLGRDAEGRPLLAMKLVRGTPWDLLIDSDFRRMHTDDYLARHLQVLTSMCQAVAFAHSRRIIHRDLKPSQVMVGEFGEVLLMDWGLALMMDSARDDGFPVARVSQRITTPATATNPAGTPSMMAPEQTLESAVGISTLTDIYLLGGTLYYLLTGRYPHDSESSEESIQHSRSVDVQVPARDAFGRPIPSELAELARRALQRDPSMRPRDVEEFMEEIKSYISGSSRRRESQDLSTRATQCLEQFNARLQTGSIARSAAAEVYQELNECLSLVERALVRWPGNPDVPPLHDTLLERYAEVALNHGDLALARVMAERIENEPVKSRMLQQVSRRESQIRVERRQRRFGIVAVGVLTLALIVGTLQFSASMARKNVELETRGAKLEEANIAANRAERLALRESELAHEARLAAEREQYFSSILIAEAAVAERRVEKALDVLLTKSPAHFRNWEWGHLLAVLHPEDILISNDHDYYHGDFTSDGNQFILSSNGLVHVFDRATGRLQREIPAGRGVLWGFDLARNDSLFAGASFDARTYVLRLSDGEILHSLVASEYQRIARFSPDGTRLLTGGADNRFHVYDVDTGGLVMQSDNLTNVAYCAAWNPDGTRFLIGVRRTAVMIFDSQSGKQIGAIPELGENTLGVRWSQDGDRILTASSDGKARLYDSESLELIQNYDNVTSWLHDADLSPDGSMVVTADDEGTARLFDAHTGAVLGMVHSLGPMFKVCFSPEGDSILAVSSREARLYNVDRLRGKVVREELQNPGAVTHMPELRIYGVPSFRDRVFGDSEATWNVTSGGSIVRSNGEEFFVRSRYAAVAPDGKWVATIDPYGQGARIKMGPEQTLLAVVGETPLFDLAADPLGRYLALAEQQTSIHLVDTETWALVRSLQPPPPREPEEADPYFISQIAFSPKGQYLAAAYIGGGVILWEVENGGIVQHWKPRTPRDIVGLCVAFSPDGKMLASGGARTHAIIWDVQTGEEISTLTGHARTLYHIRFSPDAKRVVTASRDGSVRLWEAESGREVMVLYAGEQIPVAAGFNHDATSLAIAFTDGEARVLNSFPLDLTSLPGDVIMSEMDRLEMWKRALRTGSVITPADLQLRHGSEAPLSMSASGRAGEDIGP